MGFKFAQQMKFGPSLGRAGEKQGSVESAAAQVETT